MLPPIEAPGTKGWTKSPLTPDELARRADARLAATKNSIMEWIATLNLPSGNGKAFGRSILFFPGRYRIEVLKISNEYKNELNKLIWTGEAGKTMVLTETGLQSRANYRTLPAPLVPKFLTGFDDILMRGTQGARSITTLLNSGRKLGYSALVERRDYGKIAELRLLLTKGATRYAISWRERQMLPNQIYVQSVDAKGRPTRILWTAAWGVKGSPLTAQDVKNFRPATAGTRPPTSPR